MTWLTTLLPFIGGHALPPESDGPASRLRLVALVAGLSAILCAMYGIAAGSGHPQLMLANIYKMPMVVLLSSTVALPAGLLTWKLIGSSQRASDLVVGVASGLFTGSLVLAVLAPLVALYYQTSTWLGPVLALGTAGIATAVGLTVTARAVVSRRPGDERETEEDEAPEHPFSPERIQRRSVTWAQAVAPVVVMGTVQLASMAQLIVVAAPILYEDTVFDGGVERMLER